MTSPIMGAGFVDSLAALVFDTGGTLFDWHTAVQRALARRGDERGIAADWPAVTKTWRVLSTGRVEAGLPESGGRATKDMDDVLAETLVVALEEHAVSGFTSEDQADLVRGWREMEAWPDVPAALPRLRRRFIVAPFTILRTALVIEVSRRAGLCWDAVISCEMTGVYKTLPGAYRTAARWLDLPPERIMLVSTHNNDIRAARASGFHTAFVYRPAEWADISSKDPEPGDAVEIVATDLVDLADRLGLPGLDPGKEPSPRSPDPWTGDAKGA
jgi:2-haloacid dehalogenase